MTQKTKKATLEQMLLRRQSYAQLAKRKKVPIQLDRIVDCLHYRVT